MDPIMKIMRAAIAGNFTTQVVTRLVAGELQIRIRAEADGQLEQS